MLSLVGLLVAGLGTLPAPFVTVEQAAALVAEGAQVFDARPAKEHKKAHLPGAVPIDWQDFRDGWGRTGRLADDDRQLARDLGRLGADDNRPILVYGAGPAGFGEEGRVAWMLSYLGHPKVRILDGGLTAWSAAGRPVESGAVKPRPGHYTVRRQPGMRAEIDVVSRALADKSALVLDVRTAEEWAGARPYLEARGGHLPGARHLAWTVLFDERGRLRDVAALTALLSARGLRRDQPVIVYCTGGVRSAFVWAVLHSLGYDARNFDASFWAWAAKRELPVAVGGPP